MITVIQNILSLNELNIDGLSEYSQEALKQLRVPDSEVTIVLESSKKLRELKKSYLGIDEIPDVLSFKSGEINPETGNIYLGDIVISLEKAIDQAKDKNHSIEFEVLTLIVHGVLHLLDYDHSNEAGKKTMFEIQDRVLEVISNL
jgi:probable rRNA maturation factor